MSISSDRDKNLCSSETRKEVAPAEATAGATEKPLKEGINKDSISQPTTSDKSANNGGDCDWTQDKRCRWWSIEIYPDSAKPNWVDVLNERHLPWAISPLHDKDINEDGTDKKPHFHIIIYFPNKAYYHEVQELKESLYLCWEAGQENEPGFSEVGKNRAPPKIIAVVHARGMLRYFAHMDNAEKYQYEPSDIKGFNGLDVDKYIYTMVDIDETIKDITRFIRDAHIDEYKDLIFYAIDHADEFPDWHKCISTHTIHFRALLGSIRGAGSRYARPMGGTVAVVASEGATL